MKKIFLILVLFLFNLSIFAADVSVKGYYRKSGTYVQPYQRTIIDKKADKPITVKGYYRKSGTFVQPYQRSMPKEIKKH